MPGPELTLTIRRQATARDKPMDVNMVPEILAPCVQHKGDADLATNPFRVTTEGEQRLRGSLEQKVVQAARIALDQRVQDMRQSEDQVIIGRR